MIVERVVRRQRGLILRSASRMCWCCSQMGRLLLSPLTTRTDVLIYRRVLAGLLIYGRLGVFVYFIIRITVNTKRDDPDLSKTSYPARFNDAFCCQNTKKGLFTTERIIALSRQDLLTIFFIYKREFDWYQGTWSVFIEECRALAMVIECLSLPLIQLTRCGLQVPQQSTGTTWPLFT